MWLHTYIRLFHFGILLIVYLQEQHTMCWKVHTWCRCLYNLTANLWKNCIMLGGEPFPIVHLQANFGCFPFVIYNIHVPFFVIFVELPRAAVRILSNMTFLFVSLSYTAESAIVTAFITFIPKFIESQFGIPASNASIYTGKALPFRRETCKYYTPVATTENQWKMFSHTVPNSLLSVCNYFDLLPIFKVLLCLYCDKLFWWNKNCTGNATKMQLATSFRMSCWPV